MAVKRDPPVSHPGRARGVRHPMPTADEARNAPKGIPGPYHCSVPMAIDPRTPEAGWLCFACGHTQPVTPEDFDAYDARVRTLITQRGRTCRAIQEQKAAAVPVRPAPGGGEEIRPGRTPGPQADRTAEGEASPPQVTAYEAARAADLADAHVNYADRGPAGEEVIANGETQATGRVPPQPEEAEEGRQGGPQAARVPQEEEVTPGHDAGGPGDKGGNPTPPPPPGPVVLDEYRHEPLDADL